MKSKHIKRKAFVNGMGLVIDLGSTRTSFHLANILDNFSSVPILSDKEAMKSDWAIVGEDILSAMRTLKDQTAGV